MASENNDSTKKEKTPSSIHELTLIVNQTEYKELVKLQDLGRILYNACLGESLRRLKMVKQDKFYKETISIPKDSKENKKLRTENFKILNNRYGFKNSLIQSFAVKCKNESKFLDTISSERYMMLRSLSSRSFPISFTTS